MRPNKLKAHFDPMSIQLIKEKILVFSSLGWNDLSKLVSKLDSRGIPYHFTEPKTSPPQNDLKFCIHLLLHVVRIF